MSILTGEFESPQGNGTWKIQTLKKTKGLINVNTDTQERLELAVELEHRLLNRAAEETIYADEKAITRLASYVIFHTDELKSKDHHIVFIERNGKYYEDNYALTGMYVYDNDAYSKLEEVLSSVKYKMKVIDQYSFVYKC
jgi:UTP-glucose-1-phosphate uridylyltransferase